MTFRELLEIQVNKPSKKVEPKHKKLEAELKKLRTDDANFSVLNDVRGKFTLSYKVQDKDEKAVRKLADKGFKILKKYHSEAKEVKSHFGRFPHEPTGYVLEIEYDLGSVNEASKYFLHYSTTPNGHFGGTVEITKKQFQEIQKFTTNSPKTDNGFNQFKVGSNTIHLGYNHREIAKKYTGK